LIARVTLGELRPLDRQGDEDILVGRSVDDFHVRQVRPAHLARFRILQSHRQRNAHRAEPLDLEAAVDATEVAQHEAHLVERGAEGERLALVEHQVHAALVARVALGVDPVGLVGIDRRGA